MAMIKVEYRGNCIDIRSTLITFMTDQSFDRFDPKLQAFDMRCWNIVHVDLNLSVLCRK